MSQLCETHRIMHSRALQAAVVRRARSKLKHPCNGVLIVGTDASGICESEAEARRNWPHAFSP
jgi:hypothetical protein